MTRPPARHGGAAAGALLLVMGAAGLLLDPDPAAAQTHDHSHMHMTMSAHASHHAMTGMYGPYPSSREASGTSWQPEGAPHEGLHVRKGSWSLLFHGFADLVYDRQGGPSGGEKVFSDNMLMAMATRPLGAGTLGLRAMLSAEPATIGKEGYPRLLQTGETADGVTPLIDRQHPHDLFMELAGSYSLQRGTRAAFLYAGLPGEPALGPPAFMHRFSGAELPEAPITHHWLDSSHISYGVLTLGGVAGCWKLEGSGFRGREPDEKRYDLEAPRLDSHSFRLSWNPTPAWALQSSFGRLHHPEQLEPGVNTDRTTASAMFDRSRPGRHWQTTLAWGRNQNQPGHTLDAILIETALAIGERHTLAGRLERVRKDELFASPDPRAGEIFTVGAMSLDYRYDFHRTPHLSLGLGGLGSVAFVPSALRDRYGAQPVSGMLFLRARMR